MPPLRFSSIGKILGEMRELAGRSGRQNVDKPCFLAATAAETAEDKDS